MMENELTFYDAAGNALNPDDLRHGNATLFDTGPLCHGGIAQSLQDVAQVGQSVTQHVGTIASLFDGSKSVAVGKFHAPVGLVLLGGLAALFMFHKGR